SLLSSAELSCGLRSQTATPILRGAVCIAAGRIWPPICWRCFRASCPLLSPGPKPAAEKATQGMTRLLLRHSKKQPKPARGQQKRNPERREQNHENQIISQSPVGDCLA